MALETVAGLVVSRLLADVPGLVHGFTTRHLGSMAGSIHPRGEQAKNRAALERLIGMPTAKPGQVHGNDVALVKDGQVRRLRDGVSVPLEMVTSFFSHRGEQARAGRGFAFIGWEGPPLERAGREEGRQR